MTASFAAALIAINGPAGDWFVAGVHDSRAPEENVTQL